MKRVISLFLAIIFATSILTGCQIEQKKTLFQTEYFDIFNTYVNVSVYANSEEEGQKYSEIIHDELTRLYYLFDIHHDYEGISNLKTINDMAGIAAVQVDEDIINLLQISKTAYDESSRVFNIALGSVIKLWTEQWEVSKQNPEAATTPDQATLLEAYEHSDFSQVIIDEEASTVFIPDPLMSLNVDHIMRGYSLSKTMEYAKDKGLKSGLINIGGSIHTLGRPAGGKSFWEIGIPKKVYSTEEGMEDTYEMVDFDVVELKSGAVITKGNHLQTFQVENNTYHTLIDTKTLQPSMRYYSVTAINNDPVKAEIVASYAFMQAFNHGHEFALNQETDVLWIYNEEKFNATQGYIDMSRNWIYLVQE